MAWTAPRTYTVSEIVTAAILNTDHRDNLLAINTLFDIATGTYTDGGILVGSGAAVITALARATAGQLPVGQTTGDPINRAVFVDGGVDPKVRQENGGIEADISAITTGGLVKGTGVGTMGILVRGAATQVLRVNAGGTDLEYAAAAGGATKEFFVPYQNADFRTQVGLNTEYDQGRMSGAGEDVWFSFFVPNDFTSITSAVILLIPIDSHASANYDIWSRFAASAEDKDTNSGVDTTTTYNMTLDILFELSISGILTGLAAGDYVGIRIQNQGGTNSAHASGIRFRYS